MEKYTYVTLRQKPQFTFELRLLIMRFSDGSERRRSERTTTTSYAGEIKIFRLKKNSSNGTIM